MRPSSSSAPTFWAAAETMRSVEALMSHSNSLTAHKEPGGRELLRAGPVGAREDGATPERPLTSAKATRELLHRSKTAGDMSGRACRDGRGGGNNHAAGTAAERAVEMCQASDV